MGIKNKLEEVRKYPKDNNSSKSKYAREWEQLKVSK